MLLTQTLWDGLGGRGGRGGRGKQGRGGRGGIQQPPDNCQPKNVKREICRAVMLKALKDRRG